MIDKQRHRSFWLLTVFGGVLIFGFVLVVRHTFQSDQISRRGVQATYEPVDEPSADTPTDSTAPTDSAQEMRLLGSSFKVDEYGIIYRDEVPVGVWGVNGTSRAILRTLGDLPDRR